VIALVLAAGFGTRFRPATLTTPKPLLPFLGRPILHHVFDHLIGVGVDSFVVNAHHLAATLVEKTGNWYRGHDVAYSVEEEILGTAGGIRKAWERGLLGSDTFLVANGDVYTTLPVARLAARLPEPGVISVLGVIPNQRPEKETALWANASGRLLAVGGPRPDGPCSGPWLFTGLQMAGPGLIERIPAGSSELARDVLKPSCEKRDGAIALAPFQVPADGVWFDLGSPERLAEAERAVGEGLHDR
jgi:NDP-sugar pyrophosphorylase family protein